MLNYTQIAQKKYGSEFVNKAKSIARFLQIPLDWLFGVMYSESGISTTEYNINTNGSWDVGLIQFNDITAQSLGTSRQAILNMTALEQLDLVAAYYKPIAGKIPTFGHLYLYNLSPALFETPNRPEALAFREKVSKRYKADTGKNPNSKTNWNTVLIIGIISLVIILIYYQYEK